MLSNALVPELTQQLEQMKAEWESLKAQANQDEQELLADKIDKAEAIRRTQARDARRRQLETDALDIRDRIERIQLTQLQEV